MAKDIKKIDSNIYTNCPDELKGEDKTINRWNNPGMFEFLDRAYSDEWEYKGGKYIKTSEAIYEK